MCYSNSVLYAKSGGVGKVSSLAISLFTIVLFIIGPSIANYLPRCMAGTLLLHIGVDLVLEGVFDCKLTKSFISRWLRTKPVAHFSSQHLAVTTILSTLVSGLSP
jgi:MFS superfamily sulfate permease-like transporter